MVPITRICKRSASIALALSLLSAPFATALASRGDAVAMGQYVRARLADSGGAPEQAAAGYSALLTAAPDDLMMALRAYRGGMAAGDMALALRATRVLDARGALPSEGRLLMLAEAVRAGDWHTARATIDRIEEEDSFAFLVPILRAWANFGARDGATTALLEGRTASALTPAYAAEHRALILFAQGDEEEGLAAIRSLASPVGGGAGLAVRVAAAAALAARGDRREAIELLPGSDPVSQAARETLNKRRKLAGAADTAARGMSLLFLRLADDIRRQRETPVAISLVRVAALLDPTSDPASLLASELLGAQGSTQAALALVDRVDRKGIWASSAADARVQLLATSGDREAALSAALADSRAPRAGALELSRLGEVYSALDRHAEAADAYGRAIALIEKQGEDVPWTFWLLRGGALEQAGNWAEARPALEKAVALGPDQPVALNYLGYAQLERRENLEEAEKLIKRASELRPQDSAITDSLGWAYFLRGDIPKAIETLEKAVVGQPGEPAINEHLGDAYWAAGRRIDARYAWRAALVHAEPDVATRITAKIDVGPTSETAAR